MTSVSELMGGATVSFSRTDDGPRATVTYLGEAEVTTVVDTYEPVAEELLRTRTLYRDDTLLDQTTTTLDAATDDETVTFVGRVLTVHFTSSTPNVTAALSE
jgi:uncharacterized protein (DUF1697 family)